jgi:hypothetical protein
VRLPIALEEGRQTNLESPNGLEQSELFIFDERAHGQFFERVSSGVWTLTDAVLYTSTCTNGIASNYEKGEMGETKTSRGAKYRVFRRNQDLPAAKARNCPVMSQSFLSPTILAVGIGIVSNIVPSDFIPAITTSSVLVLEEKENGKIFTLIFVHRDAGAISR